MEDSNIVVWSAVGKCDLQQCIRTSGRGGVGGGGRGEGDGLWLLFQLGDEPGLEAVQGGSLHTSKAPEAVHSILKLFLGRMTSAGIVLCRRERHRHISQAHSAAA